METIHSPLVYKQKEKQQRRVLSQVLEHHLVSLEQEPQQRLPRPRAECKILFVICDGKEIHILCGEMQQTIH